MNKNDLCKYFAESLKDEKYLAKDKNNEFTGKFQIDKADCKLIALRKIFNDERQKKNH